jgi:hypothetical protein
MSYTPLLPGFAGMTRGGADAMRIGRARRTRHHVVGWVKEEELQELDESFGGQPGLVEYRLQGSGGQVAVPV